MTRTGMLRRKVPPILTSGMRPICPSTDAVVELLIPPVEPRSFTPADRATLCIITEIWAPVSAMAMPSKAPAAAGTRTPRGHGHARSAVGARRRLMNQEPRDGQGARIAPLWIEGDGLLAVGNGSGVVSAV